MQFGVVALKTLILFVNELAHVAAHYEGILLRHLPLYSALFDQALLGH